jgi:hypothetical protein
MEPSSPGDAPKPPAAPDYVEERDFTFRLEARMVFPESYQGEADGYAWAPGFQQLCQKVIAQVVQTAQREGWSVVPANRGRSTSDEAVLVVTKKV